MRQYVYIQAKVDQNDIQIQFGNGNGCTLGKTQEEWLIMSFEDRRGYLDQWMKESHFAPEAYVSDFQTIV